MKRERFRDPEFAHALDLLFGGELKAVVGAAEIGVDHQLAPTGRAIGADRRLGGGLDDCVELAEARQRRPLTNVDLAEAHARPLEPGQVQLGAGTVEVVRGKELPVGMSLGEGNRETRSDETSPAGYQEAHRAENRRSPRTEGPI